MAKDLLFKNSTWYESAPKERLFSAVGELGRNLEGDDPRRVVGGVCPGVGETARATSELVCSVFLPIQLSFAASMVVFGDVMPTATAKDELYRLT